jgi:hypothetical protein
LLSVAAALSKPSQWQQEAEITVFELLMMGGV